MPQADSVHSTESVRKRIEVVRIAQQNALLRDHAVASVKGRRNDEAGWVPIFQQDLVEKLCFRTGEYRTLPDRASDRYAGGDLENPGATAPEAVFHVDDVRVK